MANSVYLSPIYISVVVPVSYTLGILLNVIAHVVLIFNESSLALSHSERFCIAVFKLCSIFCKPFPWINILASSAYIIGKVVCDAALKSFILYQK